MTDMLKQTMIFPPEVTDEMRKAVRSGASFKDIYDISKSVAEIGPRAVILAYDELFMRHLRDADEGKMGLASEPPDANK